MNTVLFSFQQKVVETLGSLKTGSWSLTSLRSKAELILTVTMATNWSETNTGNAKPISDGVGRFQPVNVNTLTFMLLYSVSDQRDRVTRAAILTLNFCVCGFWIYFTLSSIATNNISTVFCCYCCCCYFESCKKINVVFCLFVFYRRYVKIKSLYCHCFE